MQRHSVTLKELQRELAEFSERFPKLQDDELFVLWFLRAFVTDDERDAAGALCGGPHDKGVDAVLIDDSTKTVVIVQGKLREVVGKKGEYRNEIVSFARLALDISGDAAGYGSLVKDSSPEVHDRLDQARSCIKKRGYKLQLHYVTIGKCSSSLMDEAARTDCPSSIQVLDGRQVLLLFSDYLDGVFLER